MQDNLFMTDIRYMVYEKVYFLVPMCAKDIAEN